MMNEEWTDCCFEEIGKTIEESQYGYCFDEQIRLFSQRMQKSRDEYNVDRYEESRHLHVELSIV